MNPGQPIARGKVAEKFRRKKGIAKENFFQLSGRMGKNEGGIP